MIRRNYKLNGICLIILGFILLFGLGPYFISTWDQEAVVLIVLLVILIVAGVAINFYMMKREE